MNLWQNKRVRKVAFSLLVVWLVWAGFSGPSIVVIHNTSNEVMTDLHLYGGGGRFGGGPWDSYPGSLEPGKTATVILPTYESECGLAINFTASGIAYSEEANAYLHDGTSGTYTVFQFGSDREPSSTHFLIGWHWRRIV